MNPAQAKEMLEHAAASVTPVETDPAARMVSLGRRSVRQRRVWGACAVAVVAALALPFAVADRPDVDDAAGTTVQFGGLTVSVPAGWRTSRVERFSLCTAEPRTVYLAVRWDFGDGASPSNGPGEEPPPACNPEGQAWMAVVQDGVGKTVSPNQLLVKDENLLEVEQPDVYRFPSVWTYRAVEEIRATSAFFSGDEQGREQLLKLVTWPSGPSAPPSGGLALPDTITSALTDKPPNNHMVVATDGKTLTLIRTKLAALRDPVPAGAECTLQKPGSIGISLDDVIVVLGDATCPQAISTGGGRVQAPAGLGQELLDLIVASDRAATERAKKD